MKRTSSDIPLLAPTPKRRKITEQSDEEESWEDEQNNESEWSSDEGKVEDSKNGSEANFVCDVCKKTVPISKLEAHLRTHKKLESISSELSLKEAQMLWKNSGSSESGENLSAPDVNSPPESSKPTENKVPKKLEDEDDEKMAEMDEESISESDNEGESEKRIWFFKNINGVRFRFKSEDEYNLYKNIDGTQPLVEELLQLQKEYTEPFDVHLTGATRTRRNKGVRKSCKSQLDLYPNLKQRYTDSTTDMERYTFLLVYKKWTMVCHLPFIKGRSPWLLSTDVKEEDPIYVPKAVRGNVFDLSEIDLTGDDTPLTPQEQRRPPEKRRSARVKPEKKIQKEGMDTAASNELELALQLQNQEWSRNVEEEDLTSLLGENSSSDNDIEILGSGEETAPSMENKEASKDDTHLPGLRVRSDNEDEDDDSDFDPTEYPVYEREEVNINRDNWDEHVILRSQSDGGVYRNAKVYNQEDGNVKVVFFDEVPRGKRGETSVVISLEELSKRKLCDVAHFTTEADKDSIFSSKKLVFTILGDATKVSENKALQKEFENILSDDIDITMMVVWNYVNKHGFNCFRLHLYVNELPEDENLENLLGHEFEIQGVHFRIVGGAKGEQPREEDSLDCIRAMKDCQIGGFRTAQHFLQTPNLKPSHDGRRVVKLSLATGCGKSHLITEMLIFRQKQKPSKNFIIFVPTRLLQDQWKQIIPHALEVGGKRGLTEQDLLKGSFTASIFICVYNSAAKLHHIKFDTAYIDESHHISGKSILQSEVSDHSTELKQLVLDCNVKTWVEASATHETLKGHTFDYPLTQAIAEGRLKDILLIMCIITHGIDEKNNASKDYIDCLAKYVVGKVLGNVNELPYLLTYHPQLQKMTKKMAEKNKEACFASAEYFVEALKREVMTLDNGEEHVKKFLAFGAKDNPDVEAILRQFEDGDYLSLSTAQILSEGIDTSFAESCMFMDIASCNSKKEVLQRIGRVLRLRDGVAYAKLVLPVLAEFPPNPKIFRRSTAIAKFLYHFLNLNVKERKVKFLDANGEEFRESLSLNKEGSLGDLHADLQDLGKMKDDLQDNIQEVKNKTQKSELGQELEKLEEEIDDIQNSLQDDEQRKKVQGFRQERQRNQRALTRAKRALKKSQSEDDETDVAEKKEAVANSQRSLNEAEKELGKSEKRLLSEALENAKNVRNKMKKLQRKVKHATRDRTEEALRAEIRKLRKSIGKNRFELEKEDIPDEMSQESKELTEKLLGIEQKVSKFFRDLSRLSKKQIPAAFDKLESQRETWRCLRKDINELLKKISEQRNEIHVEFPKLSARDIDSSKRPQMIEERFFEGLENILKGTSFSREVKLQEIWERCLERERAGGRKYPRQIRKANRTPGEEQEYKDVSYLNNLGSKPPTSGDAKQLWDEIISWKPSRYHTSRDDKLRAIRDRCLERERAGKRKYPKQIRKANRTPDEEQERKDAKYLNNLGKNPPTSGDEKILWDEIMGWKLKPRSNHASREDKLREIRDRGLERGKAGKRKYPRQIKKTNRTPDEKQEYKDASYLNNLGTNPPTAGNEKILWDEIINWKPRSIHASKEEKLRAIRDRCLDRELAGKRKYPREIQRANRTPDEEQERKDAEYLRGLGKTPPTAGNEKHLWDEIMNWKPRSLHASREDKLRAIRKRCLERERAGGRKYPKQVRKGNRTPDEEQEYKDARDLNDLGRNPPTAGNEKILWDKIMSWKPSRCAHWKQAKAKE